LAPALVLGGGAAYFELGSSRAKPVSLEQAQSRLGQAQPSRTDGRPVPGVYAYRGTGTDHLSTLSLSQTEGPTIPGTVTHEGDSCWTLRLDYSTHHWQTWAYCRHGDGLWQTGGEVWQLWPIGPVNVTNKTSTTCAAGTIAVPAKWTVNETWPSRCTGASSEVKGTMTTVGKVAYLGSAAWTVLGERVPAVHLLVTRTDTGAQTGTERYDMWVRPDTGLPLRLVQDIRVSTNTPIGKSTYTQTGTLSLESLLPLR
jgi:hypothetical protein